MDAKTLEAIKRLDFGKGYWGDVIIKVRDGKPVLFTDGQTYQLDTIKLD
jgi:hypothetical protein